MFTKSLTGQEEPHEHYLFNSHNNNEEVISFPHFLGYYMAKESHFSIVIFSKSYLKFKPKLAYFLILSSQQQCLFVLFFSVKIFAL